MIVQLSSGQGPAECELAVYKLYLALKSEYQDKITPFFNYRTVCTYNVFNILIRITFNSHCFRIGKNSIKKY